MENQNILRIVLSLAIVAAFFLPLNSTPIFGSNVSALNLLGDTFQHISGSGKLSAAQIVTTICLLVVLLIAVANLILSVTKKSTSILFNLLPLFAIIALIIFSMTQSKENVSQTLQAFGTGFYIMFIASFLMPFTSITVTNAANA